MLACDCLNVIIDTKEDDFQQVDIATLNLNEEELQDLFFKQELLQIGKLININKTHAGLIQTRNVGSWIIHYCINCGIHSHAVHRDKGASFVLANAQLLRTEAIERLKASDHFSELYKIIIKNVDVDNDDAIIKSYLPSETQNIVKGLKQIASDVIKNESLAVEERIKAFATEQYNMLNRIRERAFKDQQALINVIINSMGDKSNDLNDMNEKFSSPNILPSRLNEPLAAGSVKNSNSSMNNSLKHTPKRQKSCPAGHINSFDSEGLFDFEGLDDTITQDTFDREDSDNDDADNKDDENKTIRDQHIDNDAIAKSLPMNIPTFMTQVHGKSSEDLDDAIELDSNLDIAASIKALAKSVHGDPVFGDLPKPRYSTYI